VTVRRFYSETYDSDGRRVAKFLGVSPTVEAVKTKVT
jgi:hypothetical protein